MKKNIKKYESYKKTGIDWLGDIPNHWKELNLNRAATFFNGKSIDTTVENNGTIPVMGSGGAFAHTDTYVFNGESVLFGNTGTIGNAIYIDGPFFPISTVFYTKINKNYYTKFIYYMSTCIPLQRDSTYSTMYSIKKEKIAQQKVAAPEINEQIDISNFLDLEVGKIDAAIEKLKKRIDLFLELKSSIITSAVTGKIDLRDF